jgi:Mrp family chromosome partitioning ATPase
MNLPALITPWQEEVQRIRLATFGRGIRIVGLMSPRANSGVTTICHALAAVTASSGLKTLLVDLSGAPLENGDPPPLWLPGTGGAAVAVPHGPLAYDNLRAQYTPETRNLFNNSAQLRRTLMDELSEYAAIVVDLAPLTAQYPGAIDGMSAAVACGTVYLVCVTGHVTKTEVADGVNRLHAASVEVLGFILNDVDNPTLGSELARQVLRFHKFAPDFTSRLAGKLLTNPFLT